MKLLFAILVSYMACLRFAPQFRVLKTLLGFATVSVLVLVYPFVNNLLAGWMEGEWVAPPACKAEAPDYIVVLAGGVDPHPSYQNAWSNFSTASRLRILEGTHLAISNPDAQLVFAGNREEADLFRKGLRQSGLVDLDRTIIDGQSYDTAISAARIANLVNPKSDRIWLVTSAMHMNRAKLSFLRRGISVCPNPVDFLALRNPKPWWVLPPHAAIDRTEHLVHEFAGIIWYWVTDKI